MTESIHCCHPPETVNFLNTFKSPANETSEFKGIPLDLQAKVLKYRGTSKPGYCRPQSNTIKYHADTFAIYYDNNVNLNLGSL